MALLDATFADPQGDISTRIDEARKVFEQVAESDGRTDRSGLLAQLELEKRATAHGVSSNRLLDLLKEYFTTFGDKLVCFEDLQPHVQLEDGPFAEWTQFLESQSSSFVRNITDLEVSVR